MHNLIFFAGASLNWTHLGNWTIGQIFIVVTNYGYVLSRNMYLPYLITAYLPNFLTTRYITVAPTVDPSPAIIPTIIASIIPP